MQGQPKQPTSVSSSLEMKNSPGYKESNKAWMQLERETGVQPSRAFVYGFSREHAMYPEKFCQAGKMDTGLGGSYGHSDKRGWQPMATVWMKRYRQVRRNCLEGRSNRTWD